MKDPSLADALNGVKLGNAFRRLGRKPGREATRALPMAIADYVAEAFESDAVRGAIASRAVQYTAMGPWSAGTTAVLLADSAGNDGGAPGQSTIARGGPGALAEALANAARGFGAEIRTASEVVGVSVERHRATGVVLADGSEIRARAVITAIDPKRTLTTLLDPVEIGPHLRWRATNIRTPGSVSKVDLALSGLPSFDGADPERLAGRIVIAPSIDHLERAFDASKYGGIGDDPYLEATIPTLSDPTLAPEGTHVMSVVAQWTPFELRETDWAAERDRLGDLVVKTLERYAPGLSDLVTARQRDDPGRPGARVRPERGPRLPRRARPRSVLRLAATARARPVPARAPRSVPVWFGRASRGRRDRRPGSERRPRDPRRPEEAFLEEPQSARKMNSIASQTRS